jgi:hypothetical protein
LLAGSSDYVVDGDMAEMRGRIHPSLDNKTKALWLGDWMGREVGFFTALLKKA